MRHLPRRSPAFTLSEELKNKRESGFSSTDSADPGMPEPETIPPCFPWTYPEDGRMDQAADGGVQKCSGRRCEIHTA